MRGLVFTMLLILADLTYGQEIAGVGDFKIGMSTPEFLALSSIREKRISDATEEKQVPNEIDLLKATKDAVLLPKYNRIYSRDIEKYMFRQSIGIPDLNGKDMYWMTATFYQDKMAGISVHGAHSKFEEILTAKYGAPTKDNQTKSVVCQNGYGAKRDFVEGNTYTKWGKGKIIGALGFSYHFCEMTGASYSVEDTQTMDIVRQLQKSGREAAEKEENKNSAAGSKL